MADERKPGRCARPEPPVETRWKPGESGNPRGRPKGRAEFVAEAHAVLSEPVTARTADGRTETLAALEAAYLALCRNGLKGHVPSLVVAIRTALEVLPADEARAMEAERDPYALRRLLTEKLGFPVPDYMKPRW